MIPQSENQMKFFFEMSEHQISAREFFSETLLESLRRNFQLGELLVSYFTPQGDFLSWITQRDVVPDGKHHPYRPFINNDVVRNIIYRDAVRDHLTYFDVLPRLYKSTDIIGQQDYDSSAYVRFLSEQFQAHYSASMAFGINGCVQLTFFKTKEEGDFTPSEMEELHQIYLYVGSFYKTLKTHEQARVISSIQSELLALGEKAYFITDESMSIISHNQVAQTYLVDLLGLPITEQLHRSGARHWLAFLFGGLEDEIPPEGLSVRVSKYYALKLYAYHQPYSCKIVDHYYYITITRRNDGEGDQLGLNLPLTQAEQKVAELMYRGLTYKAIADHLVVSYHTVKKHVQNIYLKCGVNSRFQLCAWIERKES